MDGTTKTSTPKSFSPRSPVVGGGKAPDDVITLITNLNSVFFLINIFTDKEVFLLSSSEEKGLTEPRDLHSEVLLPEVSSSGGGKTSDEDSTRIKIDYKSPSEVCSKAPSSTSRQSAFEGSDTQGLVQEVEMEQTKPHLTQSSGLSFDDSLLSMTPSEGTDP